MCIPGTCITVLRACGSNRGGIETDGVQRLTVSLPGTNNLSVMCSEEIRYDQRCGDILGALLATSFPEWSRHLAELIGFSRSYDCLYLGAS